MKDKSIFDQEVPAKEAKSMFVAFVSTSICIDHNGCDAARINSWLPDKTELPFFDFGRGVCFPVGRGKESIFSHKNPVSRSANDKLQIITDDLFVIGGGPNAQPTKKHKKLLRLRGGNGSLSPHLTEVDAWEESETSQDTQRLMNLFSITQTIYSYDSDSDSDSD